MTPMNNILLVIDRQEDTTFLLEKAARLSTALQARLTIVRVVYEGIADFRPKSIDHRHDLKSFIIAAAETELDDWTEAARSRLPDTTTLTLWNARVSDGVLHAAERIGADLILKAANMDMTFGRPARTPDEWNLLRHAVVPVMLLRPDAWSQTPVILTAIDPFDANHDATSRAVLQFGRRIADALRAELDIAVAYPLFEPWAGQLGMTRSLHELQQDIEGEIRSRVQALAHGVHINYRRLIADEGTAVSVISRLVDEDDARIVILGSHGRDGIRGEVLGNTCERVLHATHCDIATVPFPEQV